MEPKIKLDPNNARTHGNKNQTLIDKSIKGLGGGRSILIDNENTIIAGNGAYTSAEKLGLPIRVVESDGTFLVAVKRTDLNYDDEKRRSLAIADNATSDTSEWNFEELTPNEIEEWEIEFHEEEEEKEAVPKEKEPTNDLILTFLDEEIEVVKIELLKHGKTYEAAVWNLLNLGS